VAIHAKLLEIYAKRRDVKAFEAVAAEAYNLTHGSGPEWDHITDLGRELDASNPMYRSGGQSGATTSARAPAPAAQPVAAAPGDLDLDLDFSLGDEPETEHAPIAETAARAAPAPLARPAPASAPVIEPPPLNMDFSAPAPAPAARAPQPAPSLDLGNSLDFEAVAPPAAATKAAPAPAVAKSDMMEFDLGGLSLDLPGNAPAPAPAAAAPAAAPMMSNAAAMGLDMPPASGGDADSPLATKLALAEEFNAIGDADGARSLAEEVVAEASGDLKSRAQKLLAEIG
jgi:pilus assembly protein FimV